MPSQKKVMVIILYIVLFFLFASLWGFYSAIRPPKLVSSNTPADLGLSYEDVSFKTDDGLRLAAWFIPSDKKNTKTLILLHGYPADKGNILPFMTFLQKEYNLLLFDFRYHGQSEGKYSTVGARETKDVLAAIEYLKTRGINEVGIWGFSMGGAVALMTAPQAPEIKAIVSESSYANLSLMTRQLYILPILKYPLGWLTGLWGKLIIGIDLKQVSPMEKAKHLNIPILIIHSTDDRVIPFSHAQLIQQSLKNNPNAEFWFQEGLVHGQLGGEYEKRVLDFFEAGL